MRVHLGERPFKCHLCARRFSLKNSLLRHYRTNHPDAAVPARNKRRVETRVHSDEGNYFGLALPQTHVLDTISCRLAGVTEDAQHFSTTTRSATARTPSPDTGVSSVQSGEDTSDGGDLIQNLLGIRDSKMLDEILDSADSAARLLGIKDALDPSNK